MAWKWYAIYYLHSGCCDGMEVQQENRLAVTELMCTFWSKSECMSEPHKLFPLVPQCR